MFKRFNSMFILTAITLISLIASAGASTYSWLLSYQPEAPQQLKK
ncbi:cyclic lactone autoinducer peptide [Phosphitispora fastidiosa]|nr:cyclic lactone autoinducer peptide [Phosphitispora fastidiosa]MBU7007271.1 cyclic lactone autoinducer peptide [Phosphitispora fastidiosa]